MPIHLCNGSTVSVLRKLSKKLITSSRVVSSKFLFSFENLANFVNMSIMSRLYWFEQLVSVFVELTYLTTVVIFFSDIVRKFLAYTLGNPSHILSICRSSAGENLGTWSVIISFSFSSFSIICLCNLEPNLNFQTPSGYISMNTLPT